MVWLKNGIFGTFVPKMRKWSEGVNYKARIRWEMAKTDPKWSKMQKNPILDMIEGVPHDKNWSETMKFSKISLQIDFLQKVKKWLKTSFLRVDLSFHRGLKSTSSG